jgi:O-antigen/teichoic acid export membrane protein
MFSVMPIRNILWSLLGEGAPMAAAIISIPLLMRGVGVERFGALTLLWAVLGYLAVLDMGLVRASIQIVAEKLGRGDTAGVAGMARTVVAMIAGLGAAVGVAVAVAAQPLASALTDGDATLLNEAVGSLYLAAVIAPTALLSGALRGLLEAHGRFRAVNLVRIVVGVLNYASPLAVLPFSDSLTAVVAAIAVGRLGGLAVFIWLCRPILRRPTETRRESLRPLLSMGGWMMLNNLLGPAMMYADRFILGAQTPTALIAYYTTPFEILTRLLFIPTALSGVLFPLAARLHVGASDKLGGVLGFGAACLAAIFCAGTAGVHLLGAALLEAWLDGGFAERSMTVMRILMLGVTLNAVAYVPYAIIQGMGRVDVTARLQLIELPFYFAGLWWLVGAYGPAGAAAAWSLRTGVDLFALLACLGRLAPGARRVAGAIALAAAAAAAASVAGLSVGGAAGDALLLTAQGAGAVTGAVIAWRLRTITAFRA